MLLCSAVITGLLFLAFAFFAVAQAATVRNGGQSAADAAALAAAQDDRDQLFDGFLNAVQEDGSWQDWLDGVGDISAEGCGAANHLADRNRSDVSRCAPTQRAGDSGYTVRIRTRFDTGKTVVPGTSGRKAQADATAVVKPRCSAEESGGSIELSCGEDEFTIDPDDPDDPDAGAGEGELEPADLFSAVLAD